MDIETIITAVVGGITSIGTYFVGLRKNKAEVDSLVLENVKGILEIQTSTIEALKEEVDELKKKIDGYEQYIDELKNQIRQMRAEMNKK
jgi:peptidoglycan hydrolase CwlO-like protein